VLRQDPDARGQTNFFEVRVYVFQSTRKPGTIAQAKRDISGQSDSSRDAGNRDAGNRDAGNRDASSE
jgi:hypothetical protein